MLTKIIYASRAVQAMPEDSLASLLTESRARNLSLHITGMLLYCRESFLQMLEGHAESVDAVFGSICRDPRHRDVRLLAREATDQRRFNDWAMGFQVAEDESLSRLPGFVPASEYPLVAGSLVRNAAVAETLLGLYARNA